MGGGALSGIRRHVAMRPRHCVWKCCGDANVTRCCPLSHVTSVIDAEWFWGKKNGGREEEGNGAGIERGKQEVTGKGGEERSGNEKAEEMLVRRVGGV